MPDGLSRKNEYTVLNQTLHEIINNTIGESLILPEMDSQAPVLARAFKTNPDPICHTNPLRIKSPTLKTKL